MPKTYTPEQRAKAIKAVIEGLSKGTPLTVICCGEGMPADNTVRGWAEQDAELADAIARARDAGWDRIAMEALEIVDTKPDLAVGADGSSRIDSGHVAWAKNRAWARLELLKKWDPKRYGELVKLGNADGSNIDLSDRLNAARERAARGD
jgi:hypothetical protein